MSKPREKTMPGIDITPLKDGLPFGARITGVDHDTLGDPSIRTQIYDTFEKRGMILFKDVEPTAKMQVMISEVFGPLKDHPVKMIERVDQDAMPGVITIRNDPTGCIVEIEGKLLATWQPWHFDHSYNDELNRAGVLRAETIADGPEGGLTAFADGIQIYDALDPAAREELDGLELIYTLDLRYEKQRFGLPATFRELQPKSAKILEFANAIPRAIHPAVWARKTGEKVVHLSPYGARGILGDETPEGLAKLTRLWGEVERVIVPYHHQWKPGDMLVWDNWRMLHSVSGMDPKHRRRMQRTTIKGDYGLGSFEHDGTGAKVLEMAF
jgi:taurine dioxygenase